MTRRLIQFIDRLPFGDATRRALIETVTDWHYERRGGAAAVARVIGLALVSLREGEHPFRNLGHDVRSATRRLRTSPLYAVFSVLTLALAIGSSTAIYALVDSILVQRQPIPNFARVVNIYHSDPRSAYGRQEISWPDYLDLKRDQKSYVTVAAWRRFPYAVVTDNGAAQMMGESVTGDYFRLLDVTPLLGRSLNARDDQPGAAPVIVLAESTWRRFFAGDPSAVGQSVKMGGVSFEIVGIMPAAFRGSNMPVVMPTPFWMPMAAEGRLGAISGYRRPDRADREDRKWMVKARLNEGVSIASAQSEASAIAARLDAVEPIGTNVELHFRTPDQISRRWAAVPMKDIYLHESMHRMVAPMVSLLLGLVVLVLLVACSNLANLTLARTARRSQEIAIRLALGASRLRLVREQLVEGAVLTIAGWSLGIVIARLLLPLLGASTDLDGSMTLTLQLHPELNAAVLTASFTAALLALSVSALGPALRHSCGNVRSVLVMDNAGTSAPRWRTRGALIAGQVIVSTLLLSISAVCFNQIRQSSRIAPGIDLERLAIAKYNFRFNGTEELRVRQEITALSDAARGIDGVDSVAISTGLPFGVTNPRANVFALSQPYIKDRYYGHQAALLISTTSIFKTLGVTVVAGRAFDDTAEAGPLTAVMSQQLAEAIFGKAAAAIGHEFQYKRQQWAGDPEHPVLTMTVVGVASETDTGVLGRREGGTLYLPINRHYEAEWTLIAHAKGDPAPIVGRLKDAMRNIDREAALTSAGTGMSLAGPSIVVYQIATAIAGTLGLFALLLAATGLYGVIADLVSRRTREIGIRIALGAERASVMRMVLLEGLRPVIVGLILGLGLASVVRMGMRPMFQRMIPASDAMTIFIGLLPLAAAAVVACFIPARRASRVDPNVALREL